ncbi:hypothetical protein N7532_007494 [Penicillium argentinense]|uniref:Uncharacterized protein n=1 Tax=Penicillium argentinense TaxID=1131581 RepID=A0A9W9K6Q0_9EURO|nr:uncharacterized protein N7532_007494 [Penicillium argentinense]KAJ5095203.1 hypothetical protein N7532_007494 [Penicillium argentinense]
MAPPPPLTTDRWPRQGRIEVYSDSSSASSQVSSDSSAPDEETDYTMTRRIGQWRNGISQGEEQFYYSVLVENALAMATQSFETNRRQGTIFLKEWSRRDKITPWRGPVVILDQMADDFGRYKDLAGPETGRCFRLKCDAISETLLDVSSLIRQNQDINKVTAYFLNLLRLCIGRMTLCGYDRSDEFAERMAMECEYWHEDVEAGCKWDYENHRAFHLKSFLAFMLRQKFVSCLSSTYRNLNLRIGELSNRRNICSHAGLVCFLLVLFIGRRSRMVQNFFKAHAAGF